MKGSKLDQHKNEIITLWRDGKIRESLVLLDYLYKDSHVRLIRKYNKFKKLVWSNRYREKIQNWPKAKLTNKSLEIIG